MEIDIKIKLEDTDIGLLIKSLFEIFKKVPQDNINIKIDPSVTPPWHPNDCNTTDDMIHHEDTSTINISDLEPNTNTLPNEWNGSSVNKIDSQKKNEK